MPELWWWQIRPTRVIDGDTVEVVVDVGFHVARTERVRLLGVDTPELFRGSVEEREKGRAAREFTESWFDVHQHEGINWPFFMRSEKGDSFGRWLGSIECCEGHKLADDLISSGHAVQV